MTALAFILGVLPLVVASGAGAAARRSLGTAVFGGMLVATFLSLAHRAGLLRGGGGPAHARSRAGRAAARPRSGRYGAGVPPGPAVCATALIPGRACCR